MKRLKKRELRGRSVDTGRKKSSLGLDFSGDRVERRKNGRFNRAGKKKIERWIVRKEG